MTLPMADNEKGMFVVISDIELKKETMQEFKKWFSESNKVVSRFDGFIGRKLLESPDGRHRILVTFRDKESFAKMHQTQEHSQIHAQAVRFMSRPPMPAFFSVVAGQ
jgi:heme-degrading monooxygenase HmoA